MSSKKYDRGTISYFDDHSFRNLLKHRAQSFSFHRGVAYATFGCKFLHVILFPSNALYVPLPPLYVLDKKKTQKELTWKPRLKQQELTEAQLCGLYRSLITSETTKETKKQNLKQSPGFSLLPGIDYVFNCKY